MRPELAYTLASLSGAMAHRLSRGSLSAGQLADLVVLDDLEHVRIARTMKRGQWILPSTTKPLPFTATRVQHHAQLADFQLPLATGLANVIGVQPNHIETDHLTPIDAQNFEADCQRDILKMVVINAIITRARWASAWLWLRAKAGSYR